MLPVACWADEVKISWMPISYLVLVKFFVGPAPLALDDFYLTCWRAALEYSERRHNIQPNDGQRYETRHNWLWPFFVLSVVFRENGFLLSVVMINVVAFTSGQYCKCFTDVIYDHNSFLYLKRVLRLQQHSLSHNLALAACEHELRL
jgi:hypothetical protein